ncbi:MAG: NlpC/P60 family protein [Bacteroidia bacterium]
MNRCLLVGFLLIATLSSCRSTRNKTTNQSKSSSPVLMGVTLPDNIDINYVEYVSNWIGAPYKYGGNSKGGTDCSGFVNTTYNEYFGIKLPRTSNELYKNSKKVEEKSLIIGDLIFFDIKTGSVSHVGMHLSGKYFVHASTKKGVIVSSRDEEYYKQHFKAFGSYR